MAYKMKKSVGATGLGANMRNVHSPAKQVAKDPPLNRSEVFNIPRTVRYENNKMVLQDKPIYGGMLDEVNIDPYTRDMSTLEEVLGNKSTGGISPHYPLFDILSGGAGVLARTGLRKAGTAATNVAARTMPTYKNIYRGLNLDDASSYITTKPQGFKHVSKNPNLKLGDIKTTEAITVGRRSKSGRRINQAVAEGTSDPRNALGGFYTTAAKKEAGERAAFAGTAQGGQSTYTFSMPKGSKVLELPGTSNMSTGNLQEAADMGYDFIKGNDYGTGVEYIPLNKAKIKGFTMKPPSFKK